MVFNWVNIGTPFSWYFVAALFLGFGVARVTRGDLGTERWTRVYVYLAIAVALAAGGLFVPGPPQLLDMRIAYLAAGSAVVGFFVFRYKLIVGLPVLLVALVFVLLLGIALRGFSPQNGASTLIARIHVFTAGPKRLDLEITPTAGENAGVAVSGTLPGGIIAPQVEVAHFSRFYFFLSSPVLYRLQGVASSAKPAPSDVLALPGGTSGLAGMIPRLPGVTVSHLSEAGPVARSLQNYRVELLDNRSLETSDAQS